MCVWGSMKPGVTIAPVASIVEVALNLSSGPVITAIRPLTTPTSAGRGSLPRPSCNTPPVMARSTS